MATSDVTNMAVFCDFENIALGARDAHYDKFDIGKVLERLLLKGSIVVKKAYCDWERYKPYKAPMHEAAFELIEIPHVRQSGKNSADIRMVVDALDLCYTKSHVDTFVVVSGDSDFSPLVSKLRENNKTVIGVGVKNSTSDLLIANCDEFIYYDDLVRERKQRVARKTGAKKAAAETRAEEPAREAAPPEEPAAKPGNGKAAKAAKSARARRSRKKAETDEVPVAESMAPAAAAIEEQPAQIASEAEAEPQRGVEPPPARESRTDEEKVQEALDLVTGTTEARAGERGSDQLWGSMVKQALKRVKPGFNESYYGFRSFNSLLEEAAARGLLVLERDEKSGGYAVRLPA